MRFEIHPDALLGCNRLGHSFDEHGDCRHCDVNADDLEGPRLRYAEWLPGRSGTTCCGALIVTTTHDEPSWHRCAECLQPVTVTGQALV